MVVSSDSDMLIYPDIKNVLRRVPRSQDYSLFKKESVIKALNLPTATHLAVLGTVSNNDYGPNASEQGFARNSAILRGIPLTTATAMLETYKQTIRGICPTFDVSQFDHARQVFLRMDPNIIKASADNSAFNGAIAEFKRAKDTREFKRRQRDNNLLFV